MLLLFIFFKKMGRLAAAELLNQNGIKNNLAGCKIFLSSNIALLITNLFQSLNSNIRLEKMLNEILLSAGSKHINILKFVNK
jgi:hypothetical protein